MRLAEALARSRVGPLATALFGDDAERQWAALLSGLDAAARSPTAGAAAFRLPLADEHGPAPSAEALGRQAHEGLAGGSGSDRRSLPDRRRGARGVIFPRRESGRHPPLPSGGDSDRFRRGDSAARAHRSGRGDRTESGRPATSNGGGRSRQRPSRRQPWRRHPSSPNLPRKRSCLPKPPRQPKRLPSRKSGSEPRPEPTKSCPPARAGPQTTLRRRPPFRKARPSRSRPQPWKRPPPRSRLPLPRRPPYRRRLLFPLRPLRQAEHLRRRRAAPPPKAEPAGWDLPLASLLESG